MPNYFLILLILIYSLNLNAQNTTTDLFQEIAYLKIYSPENLIFDDDPPLRLQLDAFDLNMTELNLDGIPIEWFIEHTYIQGTVATTQNLPEFVLSNNPFSIYQSNSHIKKLEKQGLRGDLILIRPAKIASFVRNCKGLRSTNNIVIKAQIKDNNNKTFEAKPIKLEIIASEDNECFKEIIMDNEQVEIDCLYKFRKMINKPEFDWTFKQVNIELMERERYRQLSDFLRKCQRTIKYRFGTNYANKKRLKFTNDLFYGAIIWIVLSIAFIATKHWFFPTNHLTILIRYNNKICFSNTCDICEKCERRRTNRLRGIRLNYEFDNAIWKRLYNRSYQTSYNNKTSDQNLQFRGKFAEKFPQVPVERINWFRAFQISHPNKLFLVWVVLFMFWLMILVPCFFNEYPSLIPEDCQY